jgi:CBS domain-containing protein
MRVGDYCKHGVVTVEATADVAEVSKTMRDEHVGFLIVVQEGDPARKPLGVITDRDVVLQIVARDVDAHSVTAADIMSRDPLVARESEDLNEVMQAMRLAGFRRIPVLTNDGALTGVIAIDDAIDVVAGLLCDICGSIRNEQRQERRLKRLTGKKRMAALADGQIALPLQERSGWRLAVSG